MKSLIINLERSVDRKNYMEAQCKKFSFDDIEFIKAVDGNKLSVGERKKFFDIDRFKQRYSIDVRAGEIGCTLSHQKCYRKIVEDNLPFVLILEDDISLHSDISKEIHMLENLIMQVKDPTIILLSGWYWYGRGFFLKDEYRLVNVYDAFLTHSYIINNAAAKLLIEERPFITADDWRYIRQKGVRLQAICPHLIDQNWDGNFVTTVNVEIAKRKSLKWYYRNIGRLTYMKFLKWIGHFEKA